MTGDTIAAIASGLSVSGISIIRISGNDAFQIADKVFCSVSGKSVFDMKSFSVNYGTIVDNGETVDEVLLLKMAAPKTYTREDIIEIDCHGGIVVTKKILDIVLKHGARIAEPGEFTKRAFLNGRIDLSQAEAVIDIIHSKSEIALQNSIAQLKGTVKDKIDSLRDILISDTAFIEAALDDPEHISLDGFDEKLGNDIEYVVKELNKMIDSSDNGRIIKEGINTVILGRPNAGKSSLLNSILGENRAIVTDIEGTTRDTLQETVNMKGLILNIIDTAGIRDTENIIEKIGVEKALEAAENADLILYIIDSSKGIEEDDISLITKIKERNVIYLINKTDLDEGMANESSIRNYIANTCDKAVFNISALKNTGIEEVMDEIHNMFFNGKLDFNNDIYITNMRHKELLQKTLTSVNNVKHSIEAGMPEDFYSIDLMSAYENLGLITGKNVEDDLADKIFKDFCMGK